jgi:hemerythrin
VEWKSEYSVGIPEIDEEHKLLLKCIERLDAAKEDRQRDVAVYYTLGELDEYVRVHFTVEEVIMRLIGYLGRDAHVRAHRSFGEYVKSMQEAALKHDTRDEIRAFLQDWLVNHIMSADRQYAEFLRARVADPARRPGSVRTRPQGADEHSVGIPEIDEQHKALQECVTRLVDAKDEQQRELAVFFTLREFDHYARVHFAVEEALMRIFGYPGIEAHMREHAVFVEYVASMQKLVLHRDMRDELALFLQDWRAKHVRREDRNCADYLLADSFRLAGKP